MSEQEVSAPLPQGLLDLIPQTDVCSKALAIAREVLPEPIFNHSVRVFLLSKYIAEKESSEWLEELRLPLLFVAAVCHDLGTSDLYNGKQRFEVEGADAAKAHLIAHGTSESDSHDVWIAIAVHTSPGIAERITSLSRLVRYGVKSDFSPEYRDGLGLGLNEYAAQIEELLPRLDVEKSLGDAVVKQAAKIPGPIDSMTYPNSEKHPRGSWPGILLRAHLENPEWDGVNPAF
ncbi:metal dependent phosphohydrolase [Dactylonectria estremocensis]|uniref:Metal dependent phosphohydrolase n=1 Tax=Dactylonectria estremocensis TaxID=1079267 RepID=A0A9P9DW45_9HYPO|nr:metal dependent phosphohydrolase [Dactylonectria estremocensis]